MIKMVMDLFGQNMVLLWELLNEIIQKHIQKVQLSFKKKKIPPRTFLNRSNFAHPKIPLDYSSEQIGLLKTCCVTLATFVLLKDTI